MNATLNPISQQQIIKEMEEGIILGRSLLKKLKKTKNKLSWCTLICIIAIGIFLYVICKTGITWIDYLSLGVNSYLTSSTLINTQETWSEYSKFKDYLESYEKHLELIKKISILKGDCV